MLVRQLTKQLSRTLNTALSGIADAITEVFIDLSPTSEEFYSLGSPITFAGDFEFEFEISSTMTGNGIILGDSSGLDAFVNIHNTGGVLRVTLLGVNTYSTARVNTGKLEKIRGVKTGSTFYLYINGTLDTTSTGLSSGSVTFDRVGRFNSTSSLMFDGIISDVKLTDLTTPANSLEFKLDQLTASTETNNGVTLTYQNIGTGTDVRDTYTLSNGNTQWISDLRTIDIAAQA